MKAVDALLFDSAADFRLWLEANHGSATEQWIGYFKKSSGRGGMSYAQAVDEALCFGWIDGQVRGLDEERYANRYTPRRAGSNWSEANVRRVKELIAAGRVHPAGRAAFEARELERPRPYSYENRPAELPPDLAAVFRINQAAWQFFSQQPSSYRRSMTWWVVNARQQQTRLRRLAALIEESAARRRIDEMSLPKIGTSAGQGE